jgi:hypothetical protein
MGSEWILGRLDLGGRCGLDSTDSGQGPVAGCCECGDEPSGSCATELVICPMSTVGSFRSGKARLGHDADHPCYLVPRSRMSRSYTPFRLASA